MRKMKRSSAVVLPGDDPDWFSDPPVELPGGDGDEDDDETEDDEDE
jgi:hypothetical protein